MKILDWLLASSADPQKVSLTLKGVLIGVIPTIIAFAGLTGVTIPDQEALTSIVNDGSMIVQILLGMVASAMTVWGLLRKIWRTWNGTNEVLKLHED